MGITVILAKGVSVVPVESVPGAEPHKTFAVLENAEYGVLRKTILDGKMLESLSLFCMDKEIKQVKKNEKKYQAPHGFLQGQFNSPVKSTKQPSFIFYRC